MLEIGVDVGGEKGGREVGVLCVFGGCISVTFGDKKVARLGRELEV